MKNNPSEYQYLIDFAAEKQGINLKQGQIEILNEDAFCGGRIMRCRFACGSTSGKHHVMIITEHTEHETVERHGGRMTITNQTCLTITHWAKGICLEADVFVEEYESLKRLLQSFSGPAIASC